jgi:hypothetical protein
MLDKAQEFSKEDPKRGPNCWECRHLMITWDVRTPYGCKLMGFRSRYIPSLEVLRTDGRFCGGFSAKPEKNAAPDPKTKPVQPVGKTTKRRNTDQNRRFIPINLII